MSSPAPLRVVVALLATLAALPAPRAEPGLSVRLREPDRADLLAGGAVLRADVEAPPGVAVVEVRFVVDGALLAVDAAAPYQVVWRRIDTLRDHLLRVTAIADDGSRAYDLVSIPVLGPVFRTTVTARAPSFILLDVTFVSADGRPVVDVLPEEVRLLENGERREIELFEPDARSLAVELLLDASHSTRPHWDPIAQSASLFERTLREGDRAAVEAFHDFSYIIAPMGSPPGEMERAVERFVAWGGSTRLYDALSRAALYTLGPEATQRRALILLTDGMDQGSVMEYEDARDYVLRGGLELHVVLFEAKDTLWPGVYHTDPDGRRAHRLLSRMAAATGGAVYRPSDVPMEEIFLRIGERLRAQYLVGYTSDGASPAGEAQRIDVRLKRPGRHEAHVRRAHFGGEALGRFLARQMQSASEKRRIVAARAAARSHDPAALRALVNALGVGGLAEEARLALLGRGAEVLPYLQEALGEAALRERAAAVLVELLVILTRSAHMEDLEEAVIALGEGDLAAGTDMLRELHQAGTSGPTRELLAEVLGRLGVE